MTWQILQGDCLEVLRTLPAGSVQTCVTSPPYWGLRDYGVAGQIGLEATLDDYVSKIVEVFREVRRVLRPDGTLWLNLGDCYCTKPNGSIGATTLDGSRNSHAEYRRNNGLRSSGAALAAGLKHKDLVGLPWMVAFALRADGWYLRADIVWHKRNPMPESVRDRPTKAHEYLFLLSPSETYFYDAEAIAEPLLNPADSTAEDLSRAFSRRRSAAVAPRQAPAEMEGAPPANRNRRSVWTMATQPFSGAHFATFPMALVEPCIKAGTSEHGACCRCGAPFERVLGDPVEVEGRGSGNVERRVATQGEHARTGTHLGSSVPWTPTVTPTIDWSPACKCGGGAEESVSRPRSVQRRRHHRRRSYAAWSSVHRYRNQSPVRRNVPSQNRKRRSSFQSCCGGW